jgi:hypothetical protein
MVKRFIMTAPGTEKGIEDIGSGDTITVDAAITSALATSLSGTFAPVATSLQDAVDVAAEHGAGAIGTGIAPVTSRRTEGGVIITQFKIDLEGLASVATDNDVIGLSAGGVAYIGQYLVAQNGILFKAEMSCIEVPAGGNLDINWAYAASAVLEYDDAGGGTDVITSGGDWAAGTTKQNLVPALTANDVFYLTAGSAGAAAAYTAGQFILTTYGHALLT